jgi:hypothetical protein
MGPDAELGTILQRRFAMSRARRPSYLAVVRRGNTRVFAFLQEQFKDEDAIEVIWDRRVEKRRGARRPATPERRGRERRRQSPTTWDTLGFVLVRRDGS